MQRARFELVGDVVGVTPNQVLNSVFVRRSRERFGVPRGYVAAASPEKWLAPELIATEKAVMLFEGPHDALRWEVRTRRKAVEVEKWVYDGPVDEETSPEPESPSVGNPGELFVILTLKRGAKTLLMHAGLEPKPGDVASVAVHGVESEAAHLALQRLGWSPQPDETEST